MNKNKYLEFIIKRYESNFKIYENHNLLGETIDIYAYFQDIGGRSFITKNDIIDRFEVNEHCIIKSFSDINENKLREFSSYLISLTKDLVKPHSEHKSSAITGVILLDKSPEKAIIDEVFKFKYTKYHKFYLNGWSYINLILVDLKEDKVYSNKNGLILKKVYEPNII